jgi:hypothetical protein
VSKRAKLAVGSFSIRRNRSFALEDETMTVGAGVWLGHRQIDATGRPGSSCRPLRALALAQKHSRLDLRLVRQMEIPVMCVDVALFSAALALDLALDL